MEFEFDGETVYHNSIDIENIHQMCLKAMDEDGNSYWLIVRTLLGQCTSLEWGPLVEGDSILPDSTSIRFERFDSDDNRLKKMVRAFLMPRGKLKSKIIQVTQESLEDSLGKGIDPFKYMMGFGKEGNY